MGRAPVLAMLLLAVPARAQELTPAAQVLVARGLDEIYSMDFAAAEGDFQQVLLDTRGHPFGYFGLAGAAWTNLVYGSQEGDAALEKEFLRRADLSIARANDWLKSHPRDANAMLALGGTYGLRGRLLVLQKQWLRAILDGRRALNAMRQARKADPQLFDSYLGIGSWEYYADVLPRFIKGLGKFFLSGDRKLGLEHLRLAAEKARYIQVTADLILIDIYFRDKFGSKDPPEALRIIKKLRRRYAGSPMFHQIELVCLFADKKYDQVLLLADDYLKKIKAGAPRYTKNHSPRAYLSIGTVRLARGDLKGAKEAFLKCTAFVGDRERPNWWGLWGVMRLAQVEDALGERGEARAHYEQVLKYKDFWGFHALAKESLKRPAALDLAKLELSPP